MPDSANFGDIGVNTLGHISESVDTFTIPNLQKLGMANLTPLKQVAPVEKAMGYYGKLREKSLGKDTMTGHWEMMGLEVTKPFQTFTEHWISAGTDQRAGRSAPAIRSSATRVPAAPRFWMNWLRRRLPPVI